MKVFYNRVIAEFEKEATIEKFNSKGVPAVGYVDLYAGQDQNEDNFELFAQPAVFIDWDIDHRSNPPVATITIYACFEQLRDTSNISANRDLGLKFLDYISTIDEVISGIETESTGKPVLITEGFNKMDSIVDIYLLTYECSYQRKNPRDEYQEGCYDSLKLGGSLDYSFK
jgi:hypothetical protein